MLEGYNILAFTYADWHAGWSMPQQLMTRLAPGNRVLFVDVPRSFLFGLKPRDPLGAGQCDGPRLQEVRENLWVYHPLHAFAPVGLLPFPVARQSLRINGRLLAGMVRKQMRVLGMRRRPIVWNFSPLHGKAVPYIQRRLTIYDVCDEWSNYARHVSGKMVLGWMDRQLCRGADLVFTGTGSAREKRLALNPETHVVHHGADYDNFVKAADPETEVPAELARLPHPVVGAAGVMDPERFDVELIEYLSARRPNWSIVLVGPVQASLDTARLERLPNVHLTGSKPVEELPNYLKGMDALMIPYRVNAATDDIYPLKMHEYLATGKPVVSSALPAVKPYGEVVAVAEDHAGFVAALEAVLVERGREDYRAARQAVARANAWLRRVEEKSAHIERLLRKANDSVATGGRS